jgi:hypothetical protein
MALLMVPIGWEVLQAKRYDLIITDNTMPKLTGAEMVKNLQAAGMRGCRLSWRLHYSRRRKFRPGWVVSLRYSSLLEPLACCPP